MEYPVPDIVEQEEQEKTLCRPFVKWAGGKTQLLRELHRRLPPTFNQYFEPFIGGGALFFSQCPQKAFLSDSNEELINAYQVVRDNVDLLIAHLSTHVHDKSYYYYVREADRLDSYRSWSKIARASRLIYLNKTCFNGLYRVNSRGYFNVPFGDYRNPTFCDAENLRACSYALQRADLSYRSFLAIEEEAQQGDFVYFDPPYAPLSETSQFTQYDRGGFTAKDQEGLRDLCVRLDKKGVQWLVSNSQAPLIQELYQGFNITVVQAVRAINSKAERRGRIEEVIISNY